MGPQDSYQPPNGFHTGPSALMGAPMGGGFQTGGPAMSNGYQNGPPPMGNGYGDQGSPAGGDPYAMSTGMQSGPVWGS